MNAKFLTLELALIFCGVPIFAQTAKAQSAVSVVKGKVVFMGAEGLNDVTVHFVNETNDYSAVTNDAGEYSIGLKPGKYRAWAKTEFSGGQRSAFILEGDQKVEIDFDVSNCGTEYAVGAPPAGPQPGPSSACGYYAEELKPIEGSGLQAYVLYGSRRVENDVIRYSRVPVPDSWPYREVPVVFTYDLLTIKSDSLTYDIKDNSLVATGNVIYQDGKTTQHLPKMSLSFVSGEPKVQ
jgi:hypothetical protein